MKKLLLKSLAALLVIMLLISCASLAISALSYVSGTNGPHSSYKNGKYYKQVTSIPLSGNQRADAVAVALSQVQYMESNSSGDLSGTGGGSNNYTEYCYNYGYDVGSNYAWCAAFMTWVLRQAGINKIGTGSRNAARSHLGDKRYIYAEISCGFWVSQLQQCGYWKYSATRGTKSSYVPKAGDLIFFENKGDSWADHIGMVVYTSGNTVYTIEGNTSGASGVVANGGRVAFKSYNYKTSTYIYGYGTLPYNTSSSNIEYGVGNASNRSAGLYINPESAKYLYKKSDCTGDYTVLPKGTLFEVTEVVTGDILKCKYNNTTYYIRNNSDRIIQLTKKSSSSSGGNTGGNVTDGTIHMVANIDQLSADGSTWTQLTNITSNHILINPADFGNKEATTLWVNGWCVLKGIPGKGNQTENFKYSVDGGTTWTNASNITCANIPDDDFGNTIVTLSGDSEWTKSYQGYGSNEQFVLSANLSAYAGRTVNVMLSRQYGPDNTIYVPFTTIKNVKVPGGSSSSGSGSGGSTGGSSGGSTGGSSTSGSTLNGLTLTTAYQMGGYINWINSKEYTTENGFKKSNPVSMPCEVQTTDGKLAISGWCMINGGQGDVYYSADGGTTWQLAAATTSSVFGDGSTAAGGHKEAAVSLGLTSTYAYVTKATFTGLTVDLTAYMGRTIDVMFARVVNSNPALISHFATVTGVKVGGGSSSSTPTINGTVAVSNTSSTCPFAYESSIDFINSTAASTYGITSPPYKSAVAGSANNIGLATGVTVGQNNQISINGWLVSRGGIAKYVYSIDGVNWYDCGGTVTNGEAGLATEVVTRARINYTNASDVPLSNSRFQLTCDLSGCAGNTVDVYIGHMLTFSGYTDRVTQFMTIKNVSVAAAAATTYPMAAVVNFVNGVGPDGTPQTNYAADIISGAGNVASIPIKLGATSDATVTISGWCMINGGQTNTIKYSFNGGSTWAGTCVSSGFSNGTSDHSASAVALSNMSNPSVTNANFLTATADVSNFRGQTVAVTFGRVGSDGNTYPFATISNIEVPASVDKTPSAAINYINGVGPDGTINTNYASELNSSTANQNITKSLPNILGTSGTTLSISGWCVINDGQTRVIKYSVDGGNSWAGTCTVDDSSWASGDENLVFTAETWSGLTNVATTDAIFANATADLSAYKGRTINVTFGREATDGSIVKFATFTDIAVPCAHTWVEATCTAAKTCSTCQTTEGSALGHSYGDATCTDAATCSRCGQTSGTAIGHSYSTYANDDNQHWQVCSRCSAITTKTNHTYTNGTCVCGKTEPQTATSYKSSVDFINGVGPDGTDVAYQGRGGSSANGVDSIAFPQSWNINTLSIKGWAIIDGVISGYKWSTNGTVWNDCTTSGLTTASSAILDNCASSGITSAGANGQFDAVYADLSYYNNQTLNVTFAVESEDGEIIPFVTITGVSVGTPEHLSTSFDSFSIGSTEQLYGGYSGGTVNGAQVSSVSSTTGALTITNLNMFSSVKLWGWTAYNAPIKAFGYYVDGHTAQVQEFAPIFDQPVINASCSYARRMNITVPLMNVGQGTHTISFVVIFNDNTMEELTSWQVTVNPMEGSSSSSGSIGGSSSSAPIGGSTSNTANVIILAGQSNAYGASPTDDTANIGSTYNSKTYSNVYIHFNNINVVNGLWQTVRSNTGFESYNVKVAGESQTRFGPELGLAEYLSTTHPNENYYIIKFAAAGTMLNGQWFAADAYGQDAGDLHGDMGSYLYDQLKAYVTASLNMLTASGKTPVIQSFMWVQGESDAGSAQLASSYQAYEQLLVSSLRSDFAEYSPSNGISFIDYAISQQNHSENFTAGGTTYTAGSAIWPAATALNNSKRANAQYLYDGTNPATENSSYGISKSCLINYTTWQSKSDVGYTPRDPHHLSGSAMFSLGQWLGVSMDFMSDKTISVHTHTSTPIAGTAATCTTSGLTEGSKCSTCDEILVAQRIIPATGHSIGSNGSCTNSGCTYSETTTCQHTYTENDYETDGANHWYVCTTCGENVNVTAHGADSQGYRTNGDNHWLVCATCGVTYGSTAHTLMTVEGTPATCLAPGKTEGKVCGICDYVSQEQTAITRLKHQYEGVTTDATCTTVGTTVYTCKNGCGKSYTTATAAFGHNYETEVIDATCTDMGYTVYTCSICKSTYVANYVTASGHEYTVTVIQPTCTTAGYKLHDCDNCSISYKTDFVAATGHNYSVSSEKTATCTERGYKVYKCSGCDASYQADYVAATGHSYTTSVVDPTCEHMGYTSHTCACGESYKTDYVAANGHDYKSEVSGTTTTVKCDHCDKEYYLDSSNE